MALFKLDASQEQLEVSGSNFTVPDFVSFSNCDVKIQTPPEHLHGSQPKKKWITFRLLPVDAKVNNSKPKSFVKIQPAPVVKVQPSAVQTQPPHADTHEEVPQLRQTVDTEVRICASPESGIDCDDGTTADDCSSPLGTGSQSSADQDCSETSLADVQWTVKEQEVESDHSTEDMDKQEPVLQILSVHSLAPSQKSPAVDLPIVETMPQKTNSAEAPETVAQKSNGHLTETVETTPQKPNRTKATKTVPQKLNFNSPLPKCTRLYLRRIRGINRMLKSVLVIEADYSMAVPLPQSIVKPPLPKPNTANCVNLTKKIKSEPLNQDLDMSRTMKSGQEQRSKPLKSDIGHRKREWPHTSTNSPEAGDTTDSDVEDVVEIKKPSPKSLKVHWHPPTNRKYRPRIAATRITPSVAPSCKPDRIAQLREKLKQKEAALEEIRKNMNAIDKMS